MPFGSLTNSRRKVGRWFVGFTPIFLLLHFHPPTFGVSHFCLYLSYPGFPTYSIKPHNFRMSYYSLKIL